MKRRYQMIPRSIVLTIVLLLAVTIACGAALAKHHTPEERGKALFTAVGFAGGSKACNDCHTDGSGLSRAGARKDFGNMGRTLEDAVNFCIENALGGDPIATDSTEMKDITAYIRSLGAGK